MGNLDFNYLTVTNPERARYHFGVYSKAEVEGLLAKKLNLSSALRIGPGSADACSATDARFGLCADLLGDGSDGAITFDGTTTIAGVVPAAGVYTLTRSIAALSIFVQP